MPESASATARLAATSLGREARSPTSTTLKTTWSPWAPVAVESSRSRTARSASASSGWAGTIASCAVSRAMVRPPPAPKTSYGSRTRRSRTLATKASTRPRRAPPKIPLIRISGRLGLATAWSGSASVSTVPPLVSTARSSLSWEVTLLSSSAIPWRSISAATREAPLSGASAILTLAWASCLLRVLRRAVRRSEATSTRPCACSERYAKYSWATSSAPAAASPASGAVNSMRSTVPSGSSAASVALRTPAVLHPPPSSSATADITAVERAIACSVWRSSRSEAGRWLLKALDEIRLTLTRVTAVARGGR